MKKDIKKQNKDFTTALSEELSFNLKYSLDVDPENKYSMSDSQKAFVKNYCEFKSIPMAAELSGLDLDTAKKFFISYSSQQEIRRINKAMYQRQFNNKLLTIDEISGWLSSLITDEGVPIADRIKTMDKVKVAQMLIDLQHYKSQVIDNPEDIIDVDIESEIKDLSVKSIKSLLLETKKKQDKNDEKQQLIESINDNNELSVEEEAFLKTLPAKDLLQLLNSNTKKEEKQ